MTTGLLLLIIITYLLGGLCGFAIAYAIFRDEFWRKP